jgi:hypothetical protein
MSDSDSWDESIDDDEIAGPTFAGTFPSDLREYDLYVCDECQTSGQSYSRLGGGYVNDTGITGDQVFTRCPYFTVDEIEVFEVI